MIDAIRHVGLVVADLDSSLSFWCDILGFRVISKIDESGPHIDAMMGLKDVDVTTAKLAAPDGNLVELLCFRSHPDKSRWEGRPYSTGLTHVSLTVRSMKTAVTKLSKHGVRFPNFPQRSPDGKVVVTYAIGPENVLLELVEELL